MLLPYVTAAAVQDRDAAAALLANRSRAQPLLRHVRVEHGYAGELVERRACSLG